MRRCPYSALIRTPAGSLIHARCARNRFGSGWHWHDAKVPRVLGDAHPNVRVRWRSTDTPDYHVDYSGPMVGGAA